MLTLYWRTFKKFNTAYPLNKKVNIIIKENNSSLANTILLRLGSIVFNTDINTGMLPSGSIIKNKVIAADQISISVSKITLFFISLYYLTLTP